MAGEALPIIERLRQLVTENPAALRELLPAEGEAAAKIPMESLSGPDVTDLLTRVRGRLAEFLSGRAETAPGGVTPASMLKAAPTSPAAGIPATLGRRAPSPARPPQMDIMDRLPAYGEASTRAAAEPMDLPQGQEAPPGPPTMAQGPSMTSPAEMLRRPAGGERQELVDRVKGLLQSRRGGSEEALPELQRLKPQLQPQAENLPPEVSAGLSRMGAMPSEEMPQPPEDFPVTRQAYRGAPRQGTANIPPEERFRMEGLKKTQLPPEMEDFISQMQESGQLPKDVLSQENTMRGMLAKMYGYKPRALMGGQKQVGEAASSRIGLALSQLSKLSPEEITNVLQSVKPSGIYRLGRVQEAAEQAALQYQALGEKRPAEEIVADLLRGGPSPKGMGEFSQKVLYPILKKRERLGSAPGQPLKMEDVVGALRQSGFLRSNRPSPERDQFIARVLQMMQKRLGR